MHYPFLSSCVRRVVNRSVLVAIAIFTIALGGYAADRSPLDRHAEEAQEIRLVLTKYFNARAEALESLSIPDMATFTTAQEAGQRTASAETDRLNVLVAQEQLTGTTYVRYRTAIKIDSLEVDSTVGTASSQVTETDSGWTNVSPDLEAKAITHHTLCS